MQISPTAPAKISLLLLFEFIPVTKAEFSASLLQSLVSHDHMKSSFPKRDKRQIKKKMSSSCHFAVY